MPTPEINLTVTLQDITGTDIANASLTITLCGFGQTLPRIAGTSMIAKTGPMKFLLATGTTATSIPLWGNDQISPAETYYAIEIVDDKNNVIQSGIYQFNGAQTIDLSNATQLDAPPGGGGGGGGGGGTTPGVGSYTSLNVNGNVALGSTGAGIQVLDITVQGNSTLQSATGFSRGTIVILIFRLTDGDEFTWTWGGPVNPNTAPLVQSPGNAQISVTTSFVVDANGDWLPLSSGAITGGIL